MIALARTSPTGSSPVLVNWLSKGAIVRNGDPSLLIGRKVVLTIASVRLAAVPADTVLAAKAFARQYGGVYLGVVPAKV